MTLVSCVARWVQWSDAMRNDAAKQTATAESTRIASKVADIKANIAKLVAQAQRAESAGRLGRADGIRSKIRDLRSKLDLAEYDYADALHREGCGHTSPGEVCSDCKW